MLKTIGTLTKENGLEKANLSLKNLNTSPFDIKSIFDLPEIIFKKNLEYYQKALLDAISDYDDAEAEKSKEHFLCVLLELIGMYIEEAEKEIVKRRWKPDHEKYKETKGMIKGYKKIISQLTTIKVEWK